MHWRRIMFLRKLPTTLCCLTAITAAGIGLNSAASLAQAPLMCTSILKSSQKIVGAECDPNESSKGCEDPGDDWPRMEGEDEEIHYTVNGKNKYWKLDGGSADRRGWIARSALSPNVWRCERSN